MKTKHILLMIIGTCLAAITSPAEPTYDQVLATNIQPPQLIMEVSTDNIPPNSFPTNFINEGFTPAKILDAYGINLLTNSGQGQVIGIVDGVGDLNIQYDLDVFSDCFSLPKTTIKYANSPTNGAYSLSWASEEVLDVEWAHAIAPRATILVSYAKTNTFFGLLEAITNAYNHGATVISMSWGHNHELSFEGRFDSFLTNAPAGVSFIAGSGDWGTEFGWPAVSPYVTAVGATELTLAETWATNYVWLNEVAWPWSGGGTSLYYNRPGYQNGWVMTNAPLHSHARMTPDVAMEGGYPNNGVLGYNICVTYNGVLYWFHAWGTSASAPVFAGVVTLANELRVANNMPTLTHLNDALYSIANSQYNGSDLYRGFFHDITQGTNTNFSCTHRYDCVTGLGSPIANYLVPALAAYDDN